MAMFVTVIKNSDEANIFLGTMEIHTGFKFSEENRLSVYEAKERIVAVQADGDELARCCAILGRQLPTSRVYTFVGDNAKEIVINW